MTDLLQELVEAYGPVGQEDAVREICRREAAPFADDVWVDGAGNVIALLRSGDHDAPAIRLMAHMDELSMIVKRVEPDGTLRLSPLGTMYPGNFGLGPVAVLGRHETLTAVLTLGSEHTTKESHRIWETKPDQGDKALDWLHVYAFTGRSTDELASAGVTAGTRVCVHRSKRELVHFGGYVGSYFLDDRAAIAVLLETARRLGARDAGLPADVYLVFTTGEEVGANGGDVRGSHAARRGDDRGRGGSYRAGIWDVGARRTHRRLQRCLDGVRQTDCGSFDGCRCAIGPYTATRRSRGVRV